MEPERRPRQRVARRERRGFLSGVCLRVHAWQWMGGRRGGGAGGSELWGSASAVAAIAAIAAVAAVATAATAATAAVAAVAAGLADNVWDLS